MWENILFEYVCSVNSLENNEGLEINQENFPQINFPRMEELSFLYNHLFESQVEREVSDRIIDLDVGSKGLPPSQASLATQPSCSQVSSNDNYQDIDQSAEHSGAPQDDQLKQYSTNNYKASVYKDNPVFKKPIQNAEKNTKKLIGMLQQHETRIESDDGFVPILASIFERISDTDRVRCYLDIVNTYIS